MRLLTWNLSDLDVTVPRLGDDPRVEFLTTRRADVLCLQKVAGEPGRLDEGMTRLAALLGAAGWRVSPTTGDRLHVAVLWWPPLRDTGWLLRRNDRWRRNALLVDLEGGSGVVRIGSVHLPSSAVDDQLHDLALLLAQVDDRTVLAGDWNATGSDREYDVTALSGDDRRVAGVLDDAGLQDVCALVGARWVPTWRAGDEPPWVRIDAVRVGREVAGRVTDYRVLDEVDDLSLHRPVEVAWA